MPTREFDYAGDSRRRSRTDRFVFEERTQVRGKLCSSLIASVRILLDRLEHDGREIGRQERVELARIYWLLRDDLAEYLLRVLPLERTAQREQLEQRDAQGVASGAMVHAHAARHRLLGRDVVGCTRELARERHRRQALLARQTEVGQHRAAVLAHDDVRGLDVAVDYTGC